MAAKTAGKQGKQGQKGQQGLRGPAGPMGQTGGRGERGLRGARGARGPSGTLGPEVDTRTLVKALDAELEGIYRELTAQIRRLAAFQQQLEDVRMAIRRLGGTVRSDKR